MKYFEIIFVAAFALLFRVCKCIDSETEARIDTVVEEIFIKNNNIPGAGLTLIEDNGNIQMAKGYGYRDIENGLPATNTTKFGIASITKTFTTIIIVKVLSEKFPTLGSSVLDKPIRELLPDGNFTFSDRFRSEAMSFRDLMSHRHGIRDDALGLNSGTSENLAQFAFRTRYAKEAYPFRAYGYYNNAIFNLAGVLIGQIAGKSYPELLEELLAEIGMSDSSYIKETDDFNILPKMTKGYYAKDGQTLELNMELFNRLHVSTAASGVITTPVDMAKYMSFHLNLGKVGDKQVVSEEAMLWLRQSALPIDAMHFKQSEDDIIEGMLAVGTGIGLGVYDGWLYLHMSGTFTPFTTRMVLYPGLKLGIFTIVNGPSDIHAAQYNFEYLQKEILNLVRGVTRPNQPVAKEEKKSKFQLQNNFVPSAKNTSKFVDESMYAGVFGNPVEGDMEISYTPENPNGNLYMKFGKWASGYLTLYNEQISNSTYLVNWDTDIAADFYFAAGYLIDIFIDFKDENTLYFVFVEERFGFNRDATLDTFPEIPWTEDSCSPEY